MTKVNPAEVTATQVTGATPTTPKAKIALKRDGERNGTIKTLVFTPTNDLGDLVFLFVPAVRKHIDRWEATLQMSSQSLICRPGQLILSNGWYKVGGMHVAGEFTKPT
jgi:hypothetical protein